MDTIDISDPWFGVDPDDGTESFFEHLWFDDPEYKDTGLLDTYQTVNWGLSQFQYDSGTSYDFPRDDNGQRYGADILAHPYSWSEYPAYSDDFDKKDLNSALQTYILSGSYLKPSGGTPLASALHSLYRYFMDADMQGYNATEGYHDNQGPYTSFAGYNSRHGMYYDLDYPTDSGTESDQIIQDDSYYKPDSPVNNMGCRRNYLIFLTDGEQTAGEPFSYYGGAGNWTQANAMANQQAKWIKAMRDEGWGDPRMTGVKSYIIAFGGDVNAGNAYIELQLNTMAEASDLSAYPEENFPYFAADEPEKLSSAFTTIMNTVLAGKYIQSAPAASDSRENMVAVNYFDIDGTYPLWRGHLYLYDLDTMENIWTAYNDAGEQLSESTVSSRNMFTVTKDLSGDANKIDFDTGASSDLVDLFDPDGIWGSTPSVRQAEAEDLIDFVRGEGTFAGTTIETTWLLGPIFNGNPTILGPPGTLSYQSFAGYTEFMAKHTQRPFRLYVGTLYGMMHAFATKEAGTDSPGEEIFALIPRGVLPHLRLLRDGKQISGVDSTPVYNDVLWGGTDWHTQMIIGLGNGGTSYTMLDVTDAEAGDGGDSLEVLWDFGHENLGNTWSVPVMDMIIDDDYTQRFRFGVFFGGGRKPTSIDYTKGGYFFIVDAQTGELIKEFELPDVDTVGTTDYASYDAPDSVTTDPNDNEVVGGPVILDSNLDLFYDTAYVGDMNGRIWKFTFAGGNKDVWNHCLFYDTTDTDVDGKGDDPDWRKPIIYTPTLVAGPGNSTIMFFGTGHAGVEETISESQKPNHLYAVLDNDPSGSNVCTYAEPLNSEISNGETLIWPVEFALGEKIITSIQVADQKVFFKTFNPGEVESNPCISGELTLWSVPYLATIADESDFEEYQTPTESASEMVPLPDGSLVDTQWSPDGQMIPVPKIIVDATGFPTSPLSWGEGVAERVELPQF